MLQRQLMKIVMMSGDRMDDQNEVELEQTVVKQATDKYLYTTPDNIAMFVIPKNLVGKYNYKELTGGIAESKEDFESGINRMSKEPQQDFTATTSFNFNELQKFFKVVRALGAKQITISLSTDKPMKITAENKEGENVTYWLAPLPE